MTDLGEKTEWLKRIGLNNHSTGSFTRCELGRHAREETRPARSDSQRSNCRWTGDFGRPPQSISELVCGKPLLEHEPQRQPGGNGQTDANSQIRQCNAHGHSSMPRRDENVVRYADSGRQPYIPCDV